MVTSGREKEKQMNNRILVVAIAAKCRRVIQVFDDFDSRLPDALQQEHLLRLCDWIEERAEDIPANKLHRWIGFVQGAMLAHRMVQFDDLRAMSKEAKTAHADASEELGDLLDHLDPTNSFEFDMGGQG